jgi:hypothetical protein
MKSIWKYVAFVSIGLAPKFSGAQGLDTSEASLSTASTVAASSAGQHAVLMSFILLAATVLLFLAIGKAFDLRQRRAEEQLTIEALIGSALLDRVEFVRTSVGPIVHIPFWRGSPATVEMVGRVPSAHLEQSALRIAAEAVSRLRSDYVIENRLVVGPSSDLRAAGAKGEPRMAHRLIEVLKTATTVGGMLLGVALFKYAILLEHLNLK